MARSSKSTSKAVARKAAKILRDKRYGKTVKSIAASALAQSEN